MEAGRAAPARAGRLPRARRLAACAGAILLAMAPSQQAAAGGSSVAAPVPETAAGTFFDLASSFMDEWGLGRSLRVRFESEDRLGLEGFRLRLPLLGLTLDTPTGIYFEDITARGDTAVAALGYLGGGGIEHAGVHVGPLLFKDLSFTRRPEGSLPRHGISFENLSWEFARWEEGAENRLLAGRVAIGNATEDGGAVHFTFGHADGLEAASELVPVQLFRHGLSELVPGNMHGRAGFEVAYFRDEARLSLRDVFLSVTGLGRLTVSAELLGVDGEAFATWWNFSGQSAKRTVEGDAAAMAHLTELLQRVKVESVEVELRDSGLASRYINHRAAAADMTVDEVQSELWADTFNLFAGWNAGQRDAVGALADAVVQYAKAQTRLTLTVRPDEPASLMRLLIAYGSLGSTDVFAEFGVAAEVTPRRHGGVADRGPTAMP